MVNGDAHYDAVRQAVRRADKLFPPCRFRSAPVRLPCRPRRASPSTVTQKTLASGMPFAVVKFSQRVIRCGRLRGGGKRGRASQKAKCKSQKEKTNGTREHGTRDAGKPVCLLRGQPILRLHFYTLDVKLGSIGVMAIVPSIVTFAFCTLPFALLFRTEMPSAAVLKSEPCATGSSETQSSH